MIGSGHSQEWLCYWGAHFIFRRACTFGQSRFTA
jgi:hypothetical protein